MSAAGPATAAPSAEAKAPRRGRPPSGARERILEAAIEALKADGYAGLTFAKVAARSGESKPLIAYHFGSREGLVGAAGTQVAELMTARILAHMEGARTVEEIVRGALLGTAAVMDDDVRLARLYFDLAAVSVVEPEIRSTIGAINEEWRRILAERLASASDGVPSDRLRAMTLLVIGGIQGLALERIERGDAPELSEAGELFVRCAADAARRLSN